MDAETAQILGEILERLGRIEAKLTPKRCSPKDVRQLERILPGIATIFGSKKFYAWEILEDSALRAIGPKSVGALGCLLSRAVSDQVPIGGLLVENAGRTHNLSSWKLTPSLVESTPKPGLYRFIKERNHDEP